MYTHSCQKTSSSLNRQADEEEKKKKKGKKRRRISAAYLNGFYCVFLFCIESVVKNLSENISLGCKYVTVNIEI